MNKNVYFTLAILSLILLSCRHKDDKSVECIAGTGGDVSLVVFAQYNGTGLVNYTSHPDTVFVKYGTTTSPGTHPADYDVFFVGEGGEDHIHCPNMSCGDYFLYRTAWDSLSGITHYGGYGIHVTAVSGDQLVTIQVTD